MTAPATSSNGRTTPAAPLPLAASPELPTQWGGATEKPPPLFARATAGGLEEEQWESLAAQVHDVGNPEAKKAELVRAMGEQAEQTWRANPLVRAHLATEARALHIAAKLMAKRKELDRTSVEAAAKKAARVALQAEAATVDRKGVISIEEVNARVQLDHGDEYRRWELAKVADRNLVDFLDSLAANLAATIRGGGTS